MKKRAYTFIYCLVSWAIITSAEDKDKFQPTIPEEALIGLENARKLRAEQDYQGALDEITSSIEIAEKTDQNYYRAWYNLGLVHYELGEFEKSYSALKKAIEIREEEEIDDYSIYNTFGWIYLQKGNTKEAKKYLLYAKGNILKLEKSTKQKVLHNIGILYLLDNNISKAIENLKEAIAAGNTGAKETLEEAESRKEREERELKIEITESVSKIDSDSKQDRRSSVFFLKENKKNPKVAKELLRKLGEKGLSVQGQINIIEILLSCPKSSFDSGDRATARDLGKKISNSIWSRFLKESDKRYILDRYARELSERFPE